MKYKKLPEKIYEVLKKEIKDLLKEAYRTDGSFKTTNADYADAFGMLRTLRTLRYGYLGSGNYSAVEQKMSDEPRHNLVWWFEQIKIEIEQEVEGARDDKQQG